MEAREGMEKGAMVGEILAQLEEGAGPEGSAVRHLQDVQGLLDKNQTLMLQISQNQRRGGPEDLAVNHALIKEADGNMREMLTQYEETTSELLGLARGEEPQVPPGAEGAQPAPQPAAPEGGALEEGAPRGVSPGGVTPQ